jgi:hypothetical protein
LLCSPGNSARAATLRRCLHRSRGIIRRLAAREGTTMMGTSARLLVLTGVMVIASALVVEPTQAEPKLPDQSRQETLIKTTLLTFNDANVTGNYSVLHAKSAKPFRDQFTPARLKETFKEFAEKHIDFDIIAAKTPLLTQETKLDDDGRLTLQGYFDTTPSHVYYDLRYILSEGEWKPIKINVQVK